MQKRQISERMSPAKTEQRKKQLEMRRNYAAVHPNYFDVNWPEAHSAPTRSAAILNCQKA
jgi:hypothetical protein